VSQVLSQIFTVLSTAAILGLLSVGLSISFLLGIINLGYGAFITLGAYATVVATENHVPFALACLIGLGIGAAVGALTEVTVVRRLYRSPELSILGTFGISVVITQVIQQVYGSGYRTMSQPLPGTTTLLGASVATYQLVLMAIATVVLVGIVVALRSTSLGVRTRAAAADVDLAETLGVRSSHLKLLVFALSAALAGLAGSLVSPISTIDPTMGQTYLFSAFVVVIVAGTRRVSVVAVAALAIAAVQDLTTFFSSALTAEIAVLVVAVLVLQRNRPRMWKASTT
jgi:branched-chain amino acid transport system permease protein